MILHVVFVLVLIKYSIWMIFESLQIFFIFNISILHVSQLFCKEL